MNLAFAENLAELPAIDHLAGLRLVAATGQEVLIENQPGSQGSLRLYHHLALKYGAIDRLAAAEGLQLYGEHTADARLHPGKHPNIDRLVVVLDTGQIWSVHPMRA